MFLTECLLITALRWVLLPLWLTGALTSLVLLIPAEDLRFRMLNLTVLLLVLIAVVVFFQTSKPKNGGSAWNAVEKIMAGTFGMMLWVMAESSVLAMGVRASSNPAATVVFAFDFWCWLITFLVWLCSTWYCYRSASAAGAGEFQRIWDDEFARCPSLTLPPAGGADEAVKDEASASSKV